jgi:hypothetical protein
VAPRRRLSQMARRATRRGDAPGYSAGGGLEGRDGGAGSRWWRERCAQRGTRRGVRHRGPFASCPRRPRPVSSWSGPRAGTAAAVCRSRRPRAHRSATRRAASPRGRRRDYWPGPSVCAGLRIIVAALQTTCPRRRLQKGERAAPRTPEAAPSRLHDSDDDEDRTTNNQLDASDDINGRGATVPTPPAVRIRAIGGIPWPLGLPSAQRGAPVSMGGAGGTSRLLLEVAAASTIILEPVGVVVRWCLPRGSGRRLAPSPFSRRFSPQTGR